jgi:tetratricopeptide (TPR) repeat protein
MSDKKEYNIIYSTAFIVPIIIFFLFSCSQKSSENSSNNEKNKENQIIAKKHYIEGHNNLKKGDYENAIVEFKNAENIIPSNVNYIYWVGIAQFYNNEFEKSVITFKKAIKIDNSHFKSYAMIGKILFIHFNDLDNALIYLKKAVEIYPEYLDAHFDIGRIYAVQNDPENTIKTFEYIFSYENKFANYRYEFGKILEMNSAIESAKYQYGRALELNPKFEMAKSALTKLN